MMRWMPLFIILILLSLNVYAVGLSFPQGINSLYNSLMDYFVDETGDTMTGNLTVNANISSYNIYPALTLTYDLGSGAYRWRYLYSENVSADYMSIYNIVALENITADYFIGSGAYLTNLNISGDLTGYALNVSYLYGHAGIGGMDLRGDPWYLAGTDLEIAENLDVDNDVNIDGDLTVDGSICNSTDCYNFSDFLRNIFNQSLNTTDNVIFNELNVTGGYIYLGSTESNKAIYFREDGLPQGEYLLWSNSADRFALSDELYIQDNLVLGGQLCNITDCYSIQQLLETSWFNPFNQSLNTTDDIKGNSFNATGIVEGNNLYSRNDVYVNQDGTDLDSYLYYYNLNSPTGEYLAWDDTTGSDIGNTGEDRFELSGAVNVDGNIISDAVIQASTAVLCSTGYIRGGDLRSDDEITIQYPSGGDGYLYFYDTTPTSTYLMYDDSAGGDIGTAGEEQFEFNKKLGITGKLNVTEDINSPSYNFTDLIRCMGQGGEGCNLDIGYDEASCDQLGSRLSYNFTGSDGELIRNTEILGSMFRPTGEVTFEAIGGYVVPTGVNYKAGSSSRALSFSNFVTGDTQQNGNGNLSVYGILVYGSGGVFSNINFSESYGIKVQPSFAPLLGGQDIDDLYGIYIAKTPVAGFGGAGIFGNETLLYIEEPTEADNNYQVWLDGIGAGTGINFNNYKTFIRSNLPNEITINASAVAINGQNPYYPLEVYGGFNLANKVSIYAEHNVSAKGFIDRTSVFDNESYEWDYIKDRSNYTNGTHIIHSAFYGYINWTIPDRDKPVIVQQNETQCFKNVSCTNTTPIKSMSEFERYCEYTEYCLNVTVNVTTYPYNKTEEGVNLGDEINVLRQALYDQHDGVDVIQSVNGTAPPLVMVTHDLSAEDVLFRTTVYDKEEGSALDKLKDADDMLDSKGNLNHSALIGSKKLTVNNKELWTASAGDKIAVLEQALYELREIVKQQNNTINQLKKDIEILKKDG